MKQFIVLCSMILLGVAIFNLIMGDTEDSIFNGVKGIWTQQISMHTKTP